MFLKSSQNSQKNTCARASFLIKLQVRLWHKCFHMKLAKIIRTSFLQNTSGQLLLFQDVNLLAANTCQHYHCVNRVQIESFFWTVFSCIRTEYGDLLRKSVFSPNTGKYGPEKTLYLDTFHAVGIFTENFTIFFSNAGKTVNM